MLPIFFLSFPGLTEEDCRFNPRALAGRDDRRFPHVGRYSVSIHAPSRGATCFTGRVGRRADRFNPRARVGRDWFARSDSYRYYRFNPRARVGRDFGPASAYVGTYGFNPRARVGRDTRITNSRVDKTLVSIHAPAWGATPCHAEISCRS